MSEILPETALLRRQVLTASKFKRAALDSTSAKPWVHVSVDPVASEYEIKEPPILVKLTTHELQHCSTWEGMSALLGIKGVPAARLEGKPNVRIDETPGGLIIEIE